MSEQRAPRDPDYRYTLANERTYLAYVRTGLALLVAGTALVNLDDLLGTTTGSRVVGLVVLAAGAAICAGGYLRYRSNDARIRAGLPLGRTLLPLGLAVGIPALGVLAVVLSLLG